MMQQGHTHDEHEPLHHEESDVDSRAILRFSVGLVVVMVGVYAAVWLIFQAFDRREASAGVRDFPLSVERNEIPPQPRLQIEPRQELRDLQQRDERLLNSYGWADREAGLVRIPIAEAMRLTVERGLPVRSANAASDAPAPTSPQGGATR
jgi:hypothetical protein